MGNYGIFVQITKSVLKYRIIFRHYRQWKNRMLKLHYDNKERRSKYQNKGGRQYGRVI